MTREIEIEGRLRLWHAALEECLECIVMSQRADLFPSPPQETPAGKRFDRTLIGFRGSARSQADHLLSVMPHVIQQSPADFPTWLGTRIISRQLRCMAAVYFCQIMNGGNAKAGLVASNTKAFRDDHLERVVSETFPDPESRADFDQLCEQIRQARDQLLSHADGGAANMSRSPNIISHRIPSSALDDVEMDYWRDATFMLRLTIDDYIENEMPGFNE